MENSTAGDHEAASASEYPASMGDELGALFVALLNELAWLHVRWRLYRQLFADPQPPFQSASQQIDLLNEAAPFAFHVIQKTLWHDVFLGLAILGGPLSTARHENLSLSWVPEMVPDDVLAHELRDLVDRARAACEPMLELRNKRIAHRDLSLALGRADSALPGVSREQVEVALAACRQVLNRLQEHYASSTTYYEGSRPGPGDGRDLVACLRRGAEAQREIEERMRRGELPHEWKPRASAAEGNELQREGPADR